MDDTGLAGNGLIDFGQLIPDPNAIQGQYEQAMAQSRDPMQRLQARAQMYQDPRIPQAQRDRQQLTQIMQGVRSSAPDGENDLAFQHRLSMALLSHSNPQVALAAMENLTRTENARIERERLVADTSIAQSKAGEAKTQAAISQAVGGTLLFTTPGQPDKDGLPTAPQIVGQLDANDPDFAAKAVQLKAAAAKDGQQVIPMTADNYMNGKNQVALVRGQYALAAAQQRAQATLQAAMLRAQASGQGMDGRTWQQSSRVLTGAEQSAAALENVANMEFGAHSGFLGTGFNEAHGASLFDGARDTLRNELTPQEQQQYTVFAQPIWRGVAAIESAGLAQGGQQLAAQVKAALELHPGDTAGTVMAKLAQARQDIEQGTRVQLANPKLPPDVKQQVLDTIDRLKTSIPFTVGDVQKFTRSQEKNPTLTYRQWAAQNDLGNTNTTAGPAARPSGGTPNSGLNLEQERKDAEAAIGRGADRTKVSARYKERTGQDL